MLVDHAQEFALTFDHVDANAQTGQARWVARYRFSRTGRMIVNRIEAHFSFRDVRIAPVMSTFMGYRLARIRKSQIGPEPA